MLRLFLYALFYILNTWSVSLCVFTQGHLLKERMTL
jgi:hypothetical protein